MECLEDSHFIAEESQVARAGQAGGAGADDGDAVSVVFRLFGKLRAVLHVPVGDKPLETADTDGFALYRTDAALFALGLLRTYTAADGREAVGRLYDIVRFFQFAGGDFGYEFGNPYIDRTAGHAGLVLAVEAAGRFLHRHFFGISERYLAEILVSDIRILLGHRYFPERHISHSSVLLNRSGRRDRDFSAPVPYRRCFFASVRRSPPCGRQNQGRRRRRTSFRRRR